MPALCFAPAELKSGRSGSVELPSHIQLPKETMFDKTGQWIHLETFDGFDNGLSDLIELWSSKTATQAIKESALAHFKEDLEGAALNWADNRAKLKKFASIGKELAEFEEALTDGSGIAPDPDNAAPVKSKKT